MLRPGLRWATAVALSSADLLVESGRVVAGDDAFDVRPHQFRRLLLTFETSVQGRMSAILGDDEEERIDTLTRLLRGTGEEELNELVRYFAAALERVQGEAAAREPDGWYEPDRREWAGPDRRRRSRDGRPRGRRARRSGTAW